MLTVKLKTNNPKILCVTPLKNGDTVSKQTKVTIKRNKIPFNWITFEGPHNPAKNMELGLQKYKETYDSIPPYIIKIDNDITMSRGMLDKMYNTIENCKSKFVAYCYCGFEFTGALTNKFPVANFDARRLLQGNYISFMSLINSNILEKIGGLETDDSMFRLLDWALWLKFLYYGHIGIPCINAGFTAYASPDSVSARGQEDYTEKHVVVKTKWIDPIIEKYSKKEPTNKKTP